MRHMGTQQMGMQRSDAQGQANVRGDARDARDHSVDDGEPGRDDTGDAGMAAVEAAVEAQETRVLVLRLWPVAPSAPAPRHLPTDLAGPRPAIPSDALRLRPLLVTALTCLLLLMVAGALDGMQQYALARAQMVDAVQQIRAAQALLDAQPPGRPLNAATLTTIDAELTAADADLARLSAQLARPSGVVLVGTALPRLSSRIASADSLVAAAQSACQAGHTLIDAARTILALHDAGFLDDAGRLTQRGRTSAEAGVLLQRLRASVTAGATQLDTAVARTRTADLAVLPLSLSSADHIATLRGLLASWPALHARLAAPDGWQLLAPVVLGHAPLASVLYISV